MKNILCVRPEDRDWIRLGHYEGLSFDKLPSSVLAGETSRDPDAMDVDDASGDNPDIPTVESVTRLRRRLQASQKLNAMLVAEKTRNDALLGELRRIAGRAAAIKTERQEAAGETAAAPADAAPERPPLAFLHEKGDLTQADATTPLTTTTAFSLSQMQALRALSTSLSSLLPDLRATVGDGDDAEAAAGGAGPRTWRKERVEYVESAARRHLENVRGLELGRDGEVRDGEWQGEGRRFDGAEVGALESVVEMLGGTESAGAEEEKDEEVGEDVVE